MDDFVTFDLLFQVMSLFQQKDLIVLIYVVLYVEKVIM